MARAALLADVAGTRRKLPDRDSLVCDRHFVFINPVTKTESQVIAASREPEQGAQREATSGHCHEGHPF
jgi:hypothetical protein